MTYRPLDLTDIHLNRMSWSQLTKAAEDAEIHRDYARALVLWQHAYHEATLSINKNLAMAKIHFCSKQIHIPTAENRKPETGEPPFCLKKTLIHLKNRKQKAG
ncbi:flagellar biosynthesis protein FlgM [Escherichia coli]|nr:flagellar biosynthesis protein FlgM [Escherichia coli]